MGHVFKEYEINFVTCQFVVGISPSLTSQLVEFFKVENDMGTNSQLTLVIFFCIFHRYRRHLTSVV